jgi:hypothetical protein
LDICDWRLVSMVVFSLLQDLLFDWFKRSLGTGSLQLESVRKFHLSFWFSSFTGPSMGTPHLILYFAFCFGSFSASDACDGFSSQNSSHGEASSIAACLICAKARSSGCPSVLVSLSSDPEQKPSIVSRRWPITNRISKLRPCHCRLRKVNAGVPNNKSCGCS